MMNEYTIQSICANCKHLEVKKYGVLSCPVNNTCPSFIGWCIKHIIREDGMHPRLRTINIHHEPPKQHGAKYEYFWMGDYDSLNAFLEEHAETYDVQRYGSSQRLIYNDITYELHGSCWLVITTDGRFEVRR